ncbi:hypothetical protein Lac2_29010 [Claveliimonas bilis]|uniref:WG repeat-containing protein n=1 Tax=Claveliimonas bilis TaxID=3028070 RepID=UPI00292D9D64|nr:WG repeat-containing protein [Claveliimonas bilis]BDZ84767.1 hypothetical protein Lac2_29010 [Claveliimonas bilis]
MKRNVIALFVALLGLAWVVSLSEAMNNPRRLKAHLEKAEELEAKEIYVDAISEYESALEYDPENEGIYLKMARAALNSGNSNEFESICEDMAENYQNEEALELLMEYYEENDYEDKAVQYLKDFTEEYPDNEKAEEWFRKLKGSYTELYCRYEEIGEIINDTMSFKEDDVYGIADAQGSEIVEAGYKETFPFSKDGFALVRKMDGKWIYIDEDGQTRKAPDEKYTNLGMFSDERAVAKKDGKYGYLDEDMEPAGKFMWSSLTAVAEGTGAGKKEGTWRLVNQDGEPKGEKHYDGIIMDENGFCSMQKRIFVREKDTYYIVNTKGKEIGELTFEDAKAFTEDGYAAVCKDGKWGFVNEDGELVIDYTYDDAQSFHNGYAAVKQNELWGYIDEEGTQVIKPQFVEATKFSSEGTAAVQVDDQGEEKWQLIQLDLYQ